MTASAPPPAIAHASDKASASISDAPSSESPPLELSTSVFSARVSVGDEPVPVTTLIRAILTTHVDQGPAWRDAMASWPEPELRQPVEQWIREVHPLVAHSGTLFVRLASTALCLLDPAVARAAERSGVLWDVANGIRPRAGEFLSPVGVRLLQRRAPLAAFGLDLLPTAVTLRGRAGDGPATLLALGRQESAPAGSVSDWAAAYSRVLYVGRGRSSTASPEPRSVTGLGWSRRGRLHAVLGGATGGGLVRVDPLGGAPVSDDTWPTASRAHVTEGAIALVQDDGKQVQWGVTDGGGPEALPLGEIATPVRDVAAADLQVAVVGGDGRLWTSGADRAWSQRGDVPRGGVLGASAQHVALGGPDSVVLLLPWDAGSGPTLEVRALDKEPVTRLATGGELTVVGGHREIAVLTGHTVVARRTLPARATALAISPDAAAVAVGLENGDLIIWRVDARADLRLTSYTPDAPEGADLLDIDPVVDALTALVAARAVDPPLSVGLFGAWGSGKSFFMRRLSSSVDELCREAKRSGRPQSSLWAWRNICQVRFNAWHYAAADVWAGMVEQLVRGLNESRSDRLELPAELEKLQARRLEQLTGARVARGGAQEAVHSARAHLIEARESVATRQVEERRKAAAVANARVGAAKAVAKETGWGALDDATALVGTDALPASLQSLATELTAARRSARTLRTLAGGKGYGWVVLALVIGPVIALAAALGVRTIQPDLTQVTAALTWLGTTAAVVAAWLNRVRARIDAQVARIEREEAAARQAWAVAHEQVRQAEIEAAQAAEAVASAEAEVARAALQLEQAEREAAADPGSLLVEYLAGRNTSEDYRSQLGLIGTVRADLEVISDAVLLHNVGLPDDDVVNRVILYVDDLDRCPPAVVVKVLEAVHLLLSYPLFVVIVAVDPHWVSKSLATVYPTLLTGSDVTPDHYLEKIFQLPLWLDPPSADAATAMALALLGSSPEAGEASAEQAPGEGDGRPAEAPIFLGPTSAVAGPLADVPMRVDRATSPPESIVVQEDERQSLGRLAPLLARSPRALKRFLNTYRLVKAVLGSDELPQARFLLAVTIGRPDVGERLLESILAAPGTETLGQLVDSADEARGWLEEAIPAVLEWRAYTGEELRPVIPQVQRFVFRASDLPGKEPLAVLLRRDD